MHQQPQTRSCSRKSRIPPGHSTKYNKFIPRNLFLEKNPDLIMQKIKLKGLYIRRFFQKNDHSYGASIKNTFHKEHLNTKSFKITTHLQMPSSNHHYWCQIFKHSSKLKHFSFEGNYKENLLQNLSHYITKLPKRTIFIKLTAVAIIPIDETEVYKIPKSLRYLPFLQHFEKAFHFERTSTSLPQETKLYNYYTKRLRSLKNLICHHHIDEQKGIHALMAEDEEYTQITGLGIFLVPGNFEVTNVFGNLYEPENSQIIDSIAEYKANSVLERALDSQKTNNNLLLEDDSDDNNNQSPQQNTQTTDEDDESDTAFRRSLSLNEVTQRAKLAIEAAARVEIMSFYRFHLFPNLTKLNLTMQNIIYPLSTFVIDGFRALENLKELKIRIVSRPIGTTYLFKGFLELPSLDLFSLDLEFLKGEDWSLLIDFLRNQKELESFSLRVLERRGNRERYLQQNEHLENTLRSLEGNTSLKTLYIRSPYWSLEALSRGLQPLTMKNQLQSFDFEGSDDIVTSSHTILERIGGLCEFIKKHKESLREINIGFPCEIKPSIVGHVIDAVSQLKELRKFMLYMNCNFFHGASDITEYFENTIQEGIAPEKKKKILKLKNWNPSIAKGLKKLPNLQEVGVYFDVLEKESQNQNQGKWFLDIVKALPDMKALRKFSFSTHSCEVMKGIAKKVIAGLMEAKNIREVSASVHNIDVPSGTEINEIYKVVQMINKKQAATRCDLMF